MTSTIEQMKTSATEILSQHPTLTPIKLPELDKTFNDLVSVFETHLGISQEKYQQYIQDRRKSLIPLLETLEVDIKNNISQFEEKYGELFQGGKSDQQTLLTVLQDSYKSQLQEFEDRMNQDLLALMNANQELIGRIMIKTAETGNKFNTQTEKNSKASQQLMNDFVKKFSQMLFEFHANFKRTSRGIEAKILKEIARK